MDVQCRPCGRGAAVWVIVFSICFGMPNLSKRGACFVCVLFAYLRVLSSSPAMHLHQATPAPPRKGRYWWTCWTAFRSIPPVKGRSWTRDPRLGGELLELPGMSYLSCRKVRYAKLGNRYLNSA